MTMSFLTVLSYFLVAYAILYGGMIFYDLVLKPEEISETTVAEEAMDVSDMAEHSGIEVVEADEEPEVKKNKKSDFVSRPGGGDLVDLVSAAKSQEAIDNILRIFEGSYAIE